jgi:hypothetical protein
MTDRNQDAELVEELREAAASRPLPVVSGAPQAVMIGPTSALHALLTRAASRIEALIAENRALKDAMREDGHEVGANSELGPSPEVIAEIQRKERENAAAVAGISRLPVGSIAEREWRPIETAPKASEGEPPTSVLLAWSYSDGRSGVGEAYWHPTDPPGGDWWWANTGPGDYYHSPILDGITGQLLGWQPLPQSPSKDTQP